MGGFERGDDPLGAREQLQRVQRLAVRDADVLRVVGVREPCEFGADAGVIQPRRDRVRLQYLPVRVLDDV